MRDNERLIGYQPRRRGLSMWNDPAQWWKIALVSLVLGMAGVAILFVIFFALFAVYIGFD
jgi:hypothetical protein